MVTRTGHTEPVRLDDAAGNVVRAWAALEGYGLPEIVDDGAGEFDLADPPTAWPPDPRLPTQILFGVCPVSDVEESLNQTFRDDLRFVQTGVRAHGEQTCRGAFLLDATGVGVPGSFVYAPLVDFAAGVAHHRRSVPRHEAISTTIEALEAHGAHLRSAWEAALEQGIAEVDGLVALLGTLRRPDDVIRFRTVALREGDALPTVLPASIGGDLAAAVSRPTSPLLASYLSVKTNKDPVDVADVLESLMTPARIARAAWPGEHLPHLSQQVALGAVLAEDAPALTAVNGPPGTGKSTLLRELYANVLADRAEAMVAFEEPSAAFGSVQRVWAGGEERRVSTPHPSLTGFEMVLASSNDAAVHDVSRELSALDLIGERWRERTACFRDAAATYASEYDVRFPRPGVLAEPVWGFAAAVLDGGVDTFAEIAGLSRPKEAPGTWLLKELGTRSGPQDWAQARITYTSARLAVEARLTAMERWRVDAARIDVLTSEMPDLDADEVAARTRWEASAVEWSGADVARTGNETLRTATDALDDVLSDRPGLRELLFDRTAREEWTQRRDAAAAHVRDRQGQEQVRVDRVSGAATAARTAHREHRDAAHALAAAEYELAELSANLADMPPEPVDEHWWLRSETERELGPAWIDDELQTLRQKLFVAAVRVHEVFARSTYGIAADNLRTWFAIMDGTVHGRDAAEIAAAAWQSLFLVVPLVSTPFADLGQLLRHVPPAALGWLIVDEANQAAPAAAVGGLARFRRAVVMGDPAQLEPVATLPVEVVDRLMEYHSVAAERGPRRASVQTLADSGSALGAVRGDGRIGLPLRVHHRCLEPMFAIANTLAYGGTLIHGGRQRVKRGPLGPSRWIDVPRPDGPPVHAPDWQHVLELLRCLDWNTRPSVALISPFRAVTTWLELQVQAHATELGSAGLATARQVLDAVTVGTAHTFTGRERSVVILVLGGGNAGAREWAAAEATMLTVAVTRATDDLYVIGDHARWGPLGKMAELAERVPVLETVS